MNIRHMWTCLVMAGGIVSEYQGSRRTPTRWRRILQGVQVEEQWDKAGTPRSPRPGTRGRAAREEQETLEAR